MFGGKYMRTTFYPDESFGFVLEIILKNQAKVFESNEQQFNNELINFQKKVRDKEYVIDVDQDGFETNCISKELFEFYLVDYQRSNRINAFVMLDSIYEHYLSMMCTKFIREFKVDIIYNRTHLTSSDYLLKLEVEKVIILDKIKSSFNFMLKVHKLRSFYIHPPDESKKEDEIKRIKNGVLSKYIKQVKNYDHKETLYIEDHQLLYKTKEAILDVIYDVSKQLQEYITKLNAGS